MATQVQFRRGNTAQTAAFTGAAGEITVDTTKNVVVIHNGVTAGGTPMVSGKGDTMTGALNVANNLVVTGTVGVTGATTLTTLQTSGLATLNNLTVTNDANVTGHIILTGDIALNGGDIFSTAGTFNLVDANTTVMNIGGAATSLRIGATTGAATIRNATVVVTNNGIVGNMNVNTSITFANNTQQQTATAISGSTAQFTIDSFSSTVYRSAKYFIQLTSSTSYYATEMLVIHDGTTVYTTLYNEIWNTARLGYFDASITAGTLSVLCTPVNATTTVRLLRDTMFV
jgi:hypothetical protein